MLLVTLLLKHTKYALHVEVRACLRCALTPQAQYIGHQLCAISYTWLIGPIFPLLCKIMVYGLQIIVHTCLHICVWLFALVLCIDTSGAIYRPPVCLHTTVKKAIIDCAASSANIQSGKHNILHKYLTDPHNLRCPFVHHPKFVATQVLRWCLKLDLGNDSPLPCILQLSSNLVFMSI